MKLRPGQKMLDPDTYDEPIFGEEASEDEDEEVTEYAKLSKEDIEMVKEHMKKMEQQHKALGTKK